MKKVITLAAALALGLSMTSAATADDAVKPLNQVSTIASALAPAAILGLVGVGAIVVVAAVNGNNSNGT